jgi:hypothetical protein
MPHQYKTRSGDVRKSPNSCAGPLRVSPGLRLHQSRFLISAHQVPLESPPMLAALAIGGGAYSCQPRSGKLHKLSKIMDSGLRLIGVAGRAQAVWIIPRFGPGAPHEAQGDLLHWMAA